MFLTVILSPVLVALLVGSRKYRSSFKKRFFTKHLEFLSHYVENNRIWIHALSVGEVFSAEKLVRKIFNGKDKISVIFTVSTKTGYDVAQKYINPYVKHVDYMPYDIPWVITRFIDIISPTKIIFVETDLWPNMVFLVKRLGIPLYFINAKVADKAYRKFNIHKGFISRIFLPLDKVCVQTHLDKKRFLDLGLNGHKILVSGNIKFDQNNVSMDVDKLQKFESKLGLCSGRPVLVAGSTHFGEEKILSIVLKKLAKLNIMPVLIVAPRNTERASEIYKIFKSIEIKLTVEKLSNLPTSETSRVNDVIIVDKMGILKYLYALSDLVFIGGSMVNQGGHNMLEPAFFSKPILFGSHIDDFKYIANALERVGGGVRVNNIKELIEEIVSLLSDFDRATRIGCNAFKFCNMHKGATKRIMQFLEISS